MRRRAGRAPRHSPRGNPFRARRIPPRPVLKSPNPLWTIFFKSGPRRRAKAAPRGLCTLFRQLQRKVRLLTLRPFATCPFEVERRTNYLIGLHNLSQQTSHPATPKNKAWKTRDEVLANAVWLVKDKDETKITAGRGGGLRDPEAPRECHWFPWALSIMEADDRPFCQPWMTSQSKPWYTKTSRLPNSFANSSIGRLLGLASTTGSPYRRPVKLRMRVSGASLPLLIGRFDDKHAGKSSAPNGISG